ncbi:unnamed protein product [Heligmosomoides polygyrus]|uniref:CC domain-containing protein n=1 Tax=Heligmosomoides polygyrus TaxID=6339 RepID=A0A183GIT4_HELPZ|nr:unnamed protein product [Heligmosomoides polygyrus]
MAAVRDSCIDPKATVELVGGAQRKCVPNTNSCSSGFSCQPSKRNGWLCCSVVRQAHAQFTCPLLGQQPVFTPQGGNQFCSAAGQSANCPRNSLCLSAGNSANLFICCSAAAAQVNPICPNNGVAQPSPNGYRTCSLTSLNDCDFGKIVVLNIYQFLALVIAVVSKKVCNTTLSLSCSFYLCPVV